ncbi:WhiB family transcriptional regulator [Ornithinicoccus hortensis]|uniref:WhiB family transcriptional regulator n=1 Tax=Ornithinicoccus hortensis TaxID=82346 RepID=UPI003CC814F3
MLFVPEGRGGAVHELDLLTFLNTTEEDEEASWQERALCAQTDPEAFFPEKGGSTREAKKVCVGCEVRAECLEYALAHDERFGIWGGLSERERRKLKKRAV